MGSRPPITCRPKETPRPCRLVCPERPARSANVSFFPSAVAAEAASARACVAGAKLLHFAAPGSAARPTVEPGLRLIVDEGSTRSLYRRLLRVKTISSLTARIALPDLAAAGELGSGALPVMPVQPQSRRVENARKPRRSHDHCVGSRSHGRPRRPIHRQQGRVQYRPA